MSHSTHTQASTPPRNKERRIDPTPPLKLQEIWAIRIRLQLAKCTRDLALFYLAIDSKLRGCDLVRLRVGDIALIGRAVARATVVQHKMRRSARFELTEQTRGALEAVRESILWRFLKGTYTGRIAQATFGVDCQDTRVAFEEDRIHIGQFGAVVGFLGRDYNRDRA